MHPKKMKPTKSRSKKNEKLGKFLTRSADCVSRPDLSSLRKPIDTSVSDLYQVCGLLEDGTDEVKSILSYECNIIYECRVCRSLFRSIVNLVSHKREYCREKFDITLHRHALNNYNVHSARESIIHMYKTEQRNNNVVKNDRILRSQVPKEPNKKDLTAIIDMLSKKRKEDVNEQLETENAISDPDPDRHIYLEAIDTNCSAVYQTVESSNVDTIDLMKEQITELQNITEQNTLGIVEEQTSENQFEKSDNPIQADMSDEENESLIYRLPMNNLSCSICNAKFSTKKTLTVHVKTLHTSKRLCYPCPCCTNIFANTWSVYRHLYKVHKKTNEQVRKLRLQIQEKAFHRKTIAISDIKNVRVAKVSALKNAKENNDKTQESINAESDTKFCGKRGRRSNRKATLPTYMKYCRTPIAECDETTIRIKRCNALSTSDDVQSETEDVDLVANTGIKPSDDGDISSKDSERTSVSPKICNYEMFHVQNVSSLSKEDWDMLENEQNHLSERNSVDDNDHPDITSSENIDDDKLVSPAENQDNFVPDENVKSPDIVCINANEVNSAVSKMRDKEEEVTSIHHNEKQLTDSKVLEKDKIEIEEDTSESQSSCSTRPNEKNRAFLMERKIATIADFRKLRCLLCKRKFTSVPNLRRHMAVHVGWNRYRCKQCDFKCFVKCDCVAHCNKVHNTQNNRTIIAGMILEIPSDEYTCDEDVIVDVTDPKTKSDNPDVVMADVTASCQSETRVNSGSGDLDANVISQSEVQEVQEVANASERIAESRESAEGQNVAADSNKTAQDLPDCMMNCRNTSLDDDPDLKRMVMEVIFGSADTSGAKANSDEPTATETGDGASGHVDANDNVKNAAIDESREAFCPVLNNVRHQRPARNRIKPLSADFVYDLKEMARKESALTNNSETSHMRKKAKLCN